MIEVFGVQFLVQCPLFVKQCVSLLPGTKSRPTSALYWDLMWALKVTFVAETGPNIEDTWPTSARWWRAEKDRAPLFSGSGRVFTVKKRV